jgi:capsular polysaccharide transport system ATP-binding protein
MIELEQVGLEVTARGVRRTVLRSVDIAIPTDRHIALMGSSEENRTAVLNLISGVLSPSAGRISRSRTISFPTGLITAFDAEISLRHNLEYVARMYGADPHEVVSFVKQIADLGDAFDEPYSRLPKEFKRPIGYILAFCLPFDIYAMNGIPRGGPLHVREAAEALFDMRRRTSGIILSTRDARAAIEFCEMAIYLRDEQIIVMPTVDQAVAEWQKDQLSTLVTS